MLRNLITRLFDGWRCEPDPATLDTPDDGDPDDEPLPDDATPEQEAEIAARYTQRRQRYQDRERAIAAGLVLAGNLDGFERIYAAQAAMLQARIDRTLTREYWQNPPSNTALN